MRNEDVVQIDAESPEEEKTRDEDKRQNVFSFGERSGLRGHVSSLCLYPVCPYFVPTKEAKNGFLASARKQRGRVRNDNQRPPQKNGDVRSPLRQRAIEMHVTAVNENMLAGDVAGLRRNQEQDHGGDFFGLRHALAKRDFR